MALHDSITSKNVLGDQPEYELDLRVHNEGSFELIVIHISTMKTWNGLFDIQYIEELTQMTGNYKQYSVFLSMLKSAVYQDSDSVAVKVLTYKDLQALKNGKCGNVAENSSIGNNKRYIILTYNTEFDSVNYPLPLKYNGQLDRNLTPHDQDLTVKLLKAELKKLQGVENELKNWKLMCEELSAEKEDLEELIDSLQVEVNELKLTRSGNLNNSIKKLQAELVKEKNKNFRGRDKKNQECRKLKDEISALKGKERILNGTITKLRDEIDTLKRNFSRGRSLTRRNISASLERRLNSAERLPLSGRNNSAGRKSVIEGRSLSRDSAKSVSPRASSLRLRQQLLMRERKLSQLSQGSHESMLGIIDSLRSRSSSRETNVRSVEGSTRSLKSGQIKENLGKDRIFEKSRSLQNSLRRNSRESVKSIDSQSSCSERSNVYVKKSKARESPKSMNQFTHSVPKNFVSRNNMNEDKPIPRFSRRANKFRSRKNFRSTSFDFTQQKKNEYDNDSDTSCSSSFATRRKTEKVALKGSRKYLNSDDDVIHLAKLNLHKNGRNKLPNSSTDDLDDRPRYHKSSKKHLQDENVPQNIQVEKQQLGPHNLRSMPGNDAEVTSGEFSEIDARLDRLQKLIHSSIKT